MSKDLSKFLEKLESYASDSNKSYNVKEFNTLISQLEENITKESSDLDYKDFFYRIRTILHLRNNKEDGIYNELIRNSSQFFLREYDKQRYNYPKAKDQLCLTLYRIADKCEPQTPSLFYYCMSIILLISQNKEAFKYNNVIIRYFFKESVCSSCIFFNKIFNYNYFYNLIIIIVFIYLFFLNNLFTLRF